MVNLRTCVARRQYGMAMAKDPAKPSAASRPWAVQRRRGDPAKAQDTPSREPGSVGGDPSIFSGTERPSAQRRETPEDVNDWIRVSTNSRLPYRGRRSGLFAVAA